MAENAIMTRRRARRRAISKFVRRRTRLGRLGQVEMPTGDIPEAWEANNKFFDALAAATSRAAMDEAAGTYRNEIDDLRARGIITEEHRDMLAGFIPMHVDYADAKRTGEIGPDGKKPGEWAVEKGFIEAPRDVTILDVLGFLPESLAEVAETRFRQARAAGEAAAGALPAIGIGAAGVVLALIALKVFK